MYAIKYEIILVIENQINNFRSLNLALVRIISDLNILTISKNYYQMEKYLSS